MSLRPVLAGVQSLEQLPALAGELGLAPLWNELAAARLGAGGPGLARAAVVGRRDRFFALGAECTGAAPCARRLARALAARGQSALVLALDPGARRLALAATGDACPALAIDLARVTAADLRRLDRGRAGGAAPAAGLAAHWAEALAGEAAGGRFFRRFRQMLDRFTPAWGPGIPRRDRHALALLALTRVLFLYFVEDRGWLDGRPRFLREELDRCLAAGRDPHRAFLRPLFFGTLNRPPARRHHLARRFGRIPFLNGGLFEPHPLERRWPVTLPAALWRDAFDDLFEHFHFTVSDADDAAAIGPDMLGRVFEGVMDPRERRAAGAFYTPAALVDEVTGLALAHWLAPRAGVPAARSVRRLEAPPSVLAAAAARVTILDPAAGSGAFLLGALRQLVALRTAAGEGRAPATRAVLGRSLFGVDRNPAAVRLAELRLWLEVLEAEGAGGPESVAPLPNLDCFVRQGDSLADPFHVPPPGGGHAARLAALRRELTGATGPAKRRLLGRLRRAELAAARAAVAGASRAVAVRLRDLGAAARAPDLFGGAAAPSRPAPQALAALRAERARLAALGRRLRDAEELPWFHFRAQFADVMAAGGFDLVLGNPPWVRAEALPAAQRRQLRERFTWYRGGGARGFGHLPDLAVAFLERGVDLLRPGGVLAMLVPAKLLAAGWAAAARGELARRTTILAADDLAARGRAAFDATAYPMVLALRRAVPPPGHRLPHDPAGTAQASLGSAPWALGRTGAQARLALRLAAHPRLGDRFRAALGAKTGADRVFLDPPAGVEPALVRPAVRGRDVRAFQVRPARRLLWPVDGRGAPLGSLPPGAARHLAPHEAALRRRADCRDGPWWAVFRTVPASRAHRVVWRDLARRLEAAPLAGPALERAIPLNTTYLVTPRDGGTALRLAVWLNTTWLRALARAQALPAASGHARFTAAVVESLPLPDAVLTDPELLRLGRDALAAGRLDQEAADDRAARLLDLSAGDRDLLAAG